MSPVLWWYAAAAVVLVALVLWLSWTANRLDRIHHRIDVARATLDARLLSRSGAALEVAASGRLDPARSLLLLDAAHAARAADRGEFEGAESELSESLRAVFASRGEVEQLRADPSAGPMLTELTDDCRKVELARRFHNDLVVSGRTLRSRRRVRWCRLAGHAPPLRTVDLDDALPEPLALP